MTDLTFTKPRDLYVRKMHARIDEIAAAVDRMEARGERVKTNVENGGHERITDVRQRISSARTQLADLQLASDQSWDRLRTGVEDAWSHLKAAWDAMRED